jgi:hypothetical protein
MTSDFSKCFPFGDNAKTKADATFAVSKLTMAVSIDLVINMRLLVTDLKIVFFFPGISPRNKTPDSVSPLDQANASPESVPGPSQTKPAESSRSIDKSEHSFSLTGASLPYGRSWNAFSGFFQPSGTRQSGHHLKLQKH